MKRTIIEVFGGIAVLTVMASLHNQVGHLRGQEADIDALKDRLEEATVSEDATQAELRALREQLLEQTEARMESLEKRLRVAAAGSSYAQIIAGELERAQQDAELFHSQIATDFERTKALVDAYMSEVRAKEASAAVKLSEARGQIATLASKIYRNRGELTRQMLLPTVQLNGDDTVGSGTIVFSGPNSDHGGKIETYALTSYHVVRNIFTDTPRARREGFEVTVYLPEERLCVVGKMVAKEPGIDAALIKLDTDRIMPHVANVLPRDESHEVQVWDPVCAVGCPLGNDPIPSTGEVSSLSNELNGANYWMINAPTYFGNSGGGIYRADTHQLIGVFSKIYTHGKGRPVVVPHMGLCTPIDLIYDWLEDNKLSHLLSSESVSRVDLRQFATPPK